MTEIAYYKGDIRNRRALCTELGIKEEPSHDRTDRAILGQAYEKWGVSLGNHLYGGFSAVFCDETAQSAFCLRDPLGIESFYYALTETGSLLYGSTIQSILAHPGFPRSLNENMIPIYLKLTFPAGEETFFKGIRKLMPGHCLIWKEGKVQTESYFNLHFEADEDRTCDQWADEIHAAMLQIISEMKDGEKTVSFLSGGIDSGYVFALSDASCSMTAGYSSQAFDESEDARRTAACLSRDCRVREISADEYFDILPYVLLKMEQPLGDASAPVFALSCRETARQAGICYSGEGADEFFGGYPAYTDENLLDLARKGKYAAYPEVMTDTEIHSLLRKRPDNTDTSFLTEEIRRSVQGQDAFTQMSAIDIGLWLEGDIYLNVQRMSEAAGLRIRMPISDMRLLHLTEKIPARFKVNENRNKIVFRTAAQKVLPQQIAWRKKRGFPVPLRFWLQDSSCRNRVYSVLHSESADYFFRREETDRILDDYFSGRTADWQKLWNLYTFVIWYQEYFEK